MSVRTRQFCRLSNMTLTRQGLICDQATITPFANLTYLINGGCPCAAAKQDLRQQALLPWQLQ
jgi:hypothetical protein